MQWFKNMFSKNFAILDANVILRYLLNDEDFFSESEELIESKNCGTYLEIISEVVYVLQSVYKVPRDDIKISLIELSKDITIDKYDVLKIALDAYVEKPKLDFVDCLLYGYSRLGRKVYTFDKKLIKKMN